jgi:hypothetical protein
VVLPETDDNKCRAFRFAGALHFYFKKRIFNMARIGLAVGLAVAGAAISVFTGGLGTLPVGAWAADIWAGAMVGFSVGSAKGGLLLKKEEDDEIKIARD